MSVTLVVGWYALRWRLNQAVTRTRIRAEERERLARDLHDTLLQSIQGLLLTLQAISRQPMEEETRQALVRAVVIARRAVADSRDKVSTLRASDGPPMCPMVLLLEELAVEASETGRGAEVILEGRVRELAWEVSEEIVAVLREALANARKHAQASRITVLVSFEKLYLVAQVQDDGIGIEACVLHHGVREGHFGLVGMRERARRIRGKLQIQAAPGQGTTVTLKVRASRAYARA
ncbi:sensor histidine kinase [Luteibacter sp.]|jgi:signal transduction histidine kinase|uniref:sensor histidine kinase n=1 Tax=Luteibacter sp. TaxID=1886636 RepID=UPI002F42EA21